VSIALDIRHCGRIGKDNHKAHIIARLHTTLKLVLGDQAFLAENNTIWLSMMDMSEIAIRSQAIEHTD